MSDKPDPDARPERRAKLADPIPDTLDNIAAAVMQTPAKKNWRYEKRQG